MAVRILLTGSFLECLPVNPADVVSVAALPCESGISLSCVKLFANLSRCCLNKIFYLRMNSLFPEAFLVQLEKTTTFQDLRGYRVSESWIGSHFSFAPGS